MYVTQIQVFSSFAVASLSGCIGVRLRNQGQSLWLHPIEVAFDFNLGKSYPLHDLRVLQRQHVPSKFRLLGAGLLL